MNDTDLILHSVFERIDGLLAFLSLDQQLEFMTYWKPMTEAADISAFEKAAKTFRARFCSKISGLATILPELNASVADRGHPSVIDLQSSDPSEPLPFENKIILAKEILRRFEQTNAETGTRQTEPHTGLQADSAA